MSIFKETFKQGIQDQLKIREDAMINRSAQELQWINSRNSWIRMSSAVDIVTKVDATTGKPTETDKGALANKYILQGGILNPNGTLKSGIGSDFSNAYSNKAADGTPYRLGIRPMPGITNIEVKSKGAYGSLREVTVNFQCWDIHQLEDLELLYMRPGYTVLVEWGWSPYIDNDKKFQTRVDFYDIITKVRPKETIWKELDDKMAKNGNYEAMFGYVKNYSWNARMDGGYDCTTTIISLGEVIESLKVNYTPHDVLTTASSFGLLSGNLLLDNVGYTIKDKEQLSGSYSHNILAGLFYELYEIGLERAPDGTNGQSYDVNDSPYGGLISLFHKTININGKENNKTTIGESDEQVYITLETLTNVLNKYVLLRDNNTTATGSKPPFARVTVREKGYETAARTGAQVTNGDGYLLALAHPLQVSIDPTVCLIKNKLWVNGLGVTYDTGSAVGPNQGTPVIKNYKGTYDAAWWKKLAGLIKSANDDSKNEQALIDYVQSSVGTGPDSTNELIEIQRQFSEEIKKGINDAVIFPNDKLNLSSYDDFFDLLDEGLTGNGVLIAIGCQDRNKKPLTESFLNALVASGGTNDEIEKQKQFTNKERNRIAEEQKTEAAEGAKFLNNLKQNYFVGDTWESEMGIIGNIYVNLQMLYELIISQNLEAQDKKEKNDIALYDFLKNVLSRISTAIGGINTFDIFVEPNESVARIIDINRASKDENKDVYKNAVQLEMHNLKSTVRSYKLESKIFPEQSTQVAIAAQTGGGALGTDSSTLVDFNKKIVDRIIPIKDAPTTPENQDDSKKLKTLTDSLGIIYKFFTRLQDSEIFGVEITDSDFDIDSATDYTNALKDLINFFITLGKSKIKNRAILPTVLSVEMDGLGGLIIGNIFKIPNDLLPKGYKGGEVGSKLGYVITGLSHTVGGGDWVTKIEAQTIILDDPQGVEIDYNNMVISLDSGAGATIVSTGTGGGGNTSNSGKGSVAENSQKYPVLVKNETSKKEYNSTVQQYAKVSATTPVADALRKGLDKSYITEKGNELSSNGDITENLKLAVLNFQSKIKSTAGFDFIKSKPIVITAGNDSYHRTYGDKRNRTTHCRGLAIDIRTSDYNSSQIDNIMNLLRNSGFAYVIYHGGSALHIHANISTT